MLFFSSITKTAQTGNSEVCNVGESKKKRENEKPEKREPLPEEGEEGVISWFLKLFSFSG